MQKLEKNQIITLVALAAVAVTGILIYASQNGTLSALGLGKSPEAVAKQSIDYLNSNVLAAGQVATLKSAKRQSGVIKMEITLSGADRVYESYATLDGQLLFPEAFPMGASSATPGQSPSTQASGNITPANVAKVENTMLDAYVVSGCPFGIQVQRALSNAIKAAPELAKNVAVKYIGSVEGGKITAMHGDEEAQENLRQICLREEQPAKYWGYVDCYIKKAAGSANGMPYGDTKTCQASAGVDIAKLNSCVADPNRGLAFAQKDFDAANSLNVQGSPTMILNGSMIQESQFGGRSADAMRNIVCSSSVNPPAYCSTKLDTKEASTSFSLTYAAPAGATAAANTSNCAPVTN